MLLETVQFSGRAAEHTVLVERREEAAVIAYVVERLHVRRGAF